MARLLGTGKDPNGQYGVGVVFDVPLEDPAYREMLDKGYATAVEPKDDPGRTPLQIANSVVRGDPLAHPVEAALGDEMYDDAWAKVQQQDPDATGDDTPEGDSDRRVAAGQFPTDEKDSAKAAKAARDDAAKARRESASSDKVSKDMAKAADDASKEGTGSERVVEATGASQAR